MNNPVASGNTAGQPAGTRMTGNVGSGGVPRPAAGKYPEIDLLALAKAIWRNAVFVLLAGVICGVLAFFIVSSFVTPKYRAAAMFYVNNSNFTVGGSSFSISSGELSAAQTLVDTYVTILTSRPTLEEIMKEANVAYPMNAFREMIATENVKNTGIFKVTVTSENPLEAELIANTVTRVLPERISEIVDGSSVRIVESAVVPAGRSSPDLLKSTATGVLAGMLAVIAVIALRFLLSPPPVKLILSADDLTALWPELPVLAMIPDMRDEPAAKSDSRHKKTARGSSGDEALSDYSEFFYASAPAHSRNEADESRKEV